MSEEQKNIEESKTADTSKGERLRLAREALGLEIEDVAVKLYFETRFIRALENDDYSIFAGSAYLYGYMRAYVKLLDLPLDEFVRDLKNIEDENERQFENISYQTASPGERKKWLLPVLLGLLLLVAAIAGFILLRAEDSARADSLAKTDGGVADAQAMPGIPLASADDALSKPGAAKIKTKTERLTTTKIHVLPIASPKAPDKIAPPRLLLEYKTDSWTDIRDASGKRLVYRMVEKGNRLQLDSSSSYSVLLGYSPGVSVSWDNQPFNTSKYERENIAYFVVGNKKKTPSAITMRE
ncbi:MAG TPA: helix-turn-helix domain-containing protein [Gammaproteobacteria bacterium]|nr:helix-turn-helix domain-containing protein [Gammaproteobacteria bacterium]